MFDEGMGEISRLFRKGYKTETVAAIWDAVKSEPDSAMTRAFYRVEVEFHPDQLVPIAKIRDIILQEGKKIREADTVRREQESAQMKKEEAQPWAEPSTSYGKACASFLKAAFSGQYSREQLKAMAEKQEARFHKMGFDAWLDGVLTEEGWEKRHRRGGAVKALAA
jgi:hypothetical protein